MLPIEFAFVPVSFSVHVLCFTFFEMVALRKIMYENMKMNK